MNLDDIQSLIDTIKQQLESCSTLDQVEALEKTTKQEVDRQFEIFKTLSAEDKKTHGPRMQLWRSTVYKLFDNKKVALKNAELEAKENQESIDVTIPSKPLGGSLHPLTLVQNELIDTFHSLGFAVMRGPEAEFEYYNFEALNIPATHPARDMQDTFFLNSANQVMRTHTSSVQVRAMEQYGAPLRMIVPGRVFRNEALDASHDHTFYQLEGMMIDKNLTIGNLLAVMKLLLKEMFGREIKVRLRPGYFPFVEPGFELDAECAICTGSGCSVCKRSGWVELIPCGMIHPKVLEAGKIDSSQYNGWAFGMGLSRLVMMKYKIDDIRLMQGADLRFLSQFAL